MRLFIGEVFINNFLFWYFWKFSEQKWYDFVLRFSQKQKNLQIFCSEFWCLTRIDRRSRFIFLFSILFYTSPRSKYFDKISRDRIIMTVVKFVFNSPHIDFVLKFLINTSPRYKIENYVLYWGNHKKNWVLPGHDEPRMRV